MTIPASMPAAEECAASAALDDHRLAKLVQHHPLVPLPVPRPIPETLPKRGGKQLMRVAEAKPSKGVAVRAAAAVAAVGAAKPAAEPAAEPAATSVAAEAAATAAAASAAAAAAAAAATGVVAATHPPLEALLSDGVVDVAHLLAREHLVRAARSHEFRFRLRLLLVRASRLVRVVLQRQRPVRLLEPLVVDVVRDTEERVEVVAGAGAAGEMEAAAADEES